MPTIYALKGREVAYITKLLSVFGVVEERQMKILFKHKSEREYGSMMVKLYREGLAYRTPDAKYLASSGWVYRQTDIISSVSCFWAFIKIRNKIQDFCKAEYPAVVTVASTTTDYDLIPVTAQNAEIINEYADLLPPKTVRYLITDDLDLMAGIDRRIKNDYVLLVGENGVEETYEL